MLDHVSHLHWQAIDFKHVPLIFATRVDYHIRADGILSAKESPRRCNGSFEPEKERSRRFHLVYSVDTTSATMAARATRVRTDSILADHDGVFVLVHFDRKVFKGTVDNVDQSVLAIACAKCPPSARIRLQGKEPRVPFARIGAINPDHHRIPIVSTRDLVRHCRSQRLDEQVNEQALWGEIPLAGRRLLGLEDRSFGSFNR